ncbi:MAG: flagellar basal body P-ring protein FlgI [Synergistales bacterium]
MNGMGRKVGAAMLLWSAVLLFSAGCASGEIRLKDIGRIEGSRPNQLVGMGLVVGLQGTGDKGELVTAMLGNLARNFGIVLDRKDLKSKNVAVVTVTCELPPFVKSGERVDVTLGAVGDAKSLQGGVLLQTPLKAANGSVYAAAQGSVSLGGYSTGKGGSGIAKNISTTGRIPGGALVERETSCEIGKDGKVRFFLRTPDFTTASRVQEVLNRAYGNVAGVRDAGCVEITVPDRFAGDPSAFVASMEGLQVRPDAAARVIVNERAGTVAIGGHVRILEVAVAHGNLTVSVKAAKTVSQPAPLSGGKTVPVQTAEISAQEEANRVMRIESSSTVEDVVKSLNSLGATPRDIITILQAIDQAGALQGELIIQ